MTEQIHAVGNLTRDPELRFSAGGMAITKLGIAVNNRAKNPDTGKWEDVGETQFWDVVTFRGLAENCAETLLTGDTVIVVGRVQKREFDRRDGSHGSVDEIVADEVGPSLRKYPARIARAERTKPLTAGDAPWAIAPEPALDF